MGNSDHFHYVVASGCCERTQAFLRTASKRHSTAALVLVFMSQYAGAQASAPVTPAPTDELVEIVVTGTQIRGTAPVGSTVISVGQEQIQDSGLATTSDILHDIPQVSSIGPGASTTGSGANNSSQNTLRSNGLNLRGLGVQATLTLLDGHRVPPGGTAAQLFDPSSIPTIALQSIDVVADGASATYGSDAVAGVANLVLRKDVEGIEADTRYGTARDYNEKQADIIGGHSWDTGSFMLAGEWSHNSQLLQSSRPNLFQCDQVAYGFANSCGFDAAPGNVYFPATKTRYGLPVGSGTGLTPADLSPTANYANPAYANQSSIPESNRYSVVGSVQQEVSSAVSLWAEGYYTKRDVSFDGGNPTIDSATPVPNTNPNFIYVPGQSQTSEVAQYSLANDTGSQINSGYSSSGLLTTGTNVKLGHGLALTAYIEHGEDNEFLNRDNEISSQELKPALACTDPAICFNPFGTGGSYNSAALASFIGYANFTSQYYLDLINIKVDGPILSLPGGDVKMAVGTEDHHDKLVNLSYNNYNSANLATTVDSANYHSERNVESAYIETIVPIIGAGNALPYTKVLEVDLAGRYDHYSDTGATKNPKYGLRWKPTDDITVHASYGTSFRVPTLYDINPATVLSLASTSVSPGHNVITLVGGNATLKPETAKTWSTGFDYKPAWLTGLDVSVNYYNIVYKNIIDTPGLSYEGQALAQPALFAPFLEFNPTAAQLAAVTSLKGYVPPPFAVFPGNVYAIVDGRRNNVGALLTNGLDLAASYEWKTDNWGKWNVGATGTYLFNYDYSLVPGAPFVDRVNQANYPLRFRARGNIGWSSAPLTAITYLNYTNNYEVVGQITPTQDQPVKAYTTVDATFMFRPGTYLNSGTAGTISKDLTLTLAVQNLFNSAPPFALVATTQEFDSTVASALGRIITFDIRKKF
jgi:iron complex outermembrane receptor protein